MSSNVPANILEALIDIVPSVKEKGADASRIALEALERDILRFREQITNSQFLTDRGRTEFRLEAWTPRDTFIKIIERRGWCVFSRSSIDHKDKQLVICYPKMDALIEESEITRISAFLPNAGVVLEQNGLTPTTALTLTVLNLTNAIVNGPMNSRGIIYFGIYPGTPSEPLQRIIEARGYHLLFGNTEDTIQGAITIGGPSIADQM